MVLKNLCVVVLWIKVASVYGGLNSLRDTYRKVSMGLFI